MKLAEVAKMLIVERDVYDFYESMDNWRQVAYDDFKEGNKRPSVPWKKISANQLKNLYISWAQYKFIRNPKVLQGIIDICITNTARLRVNTELGGHTEQDPLKIWEDLYEEAIDEEAFNEWSDSYLELEDGSQYAFSDYGLPKAEKVVSKMIEESDENVLFQLLDQLLNIIHQRSDFADFYVEGGSETLSKISGYGFSEEGQDD